VFQNKQMSSVCSMHDTCRETHLQGQIMLKFKSVTG